MGGNVSKNLKPNKISAVALIRRAGTVSLRHRHSKIPQVNSEIRIAAVVTLKAVPSAYRK